MDTLRIMINKEFVFFLMLSRTEQDLLVDKMLQRMVSGLPWRLVARKKRKKSAK